MQTLTIFHKNTASDIKNVVNTDHRKFHPEHFKKKLKFLAILEVELYSVQNWKDKENPFSRNACLKERVVFWGYFLRVA